MIADSGYDDLEKESRHAYISYNHRVSLVVLR